MSTQALVSVYKINSQTAIPLNRVTKIGFPMGNVMSRVASDQNGNPGVLLTTGFRPYGIIETANGNQYYTQETAAQLVALANS